MTDELAPPKKFEPAPGLVIAGKVRLERLLARGGMGSVWVGKHLSLDVQVAVKFMANTTEQSLGRFRREARVAAKIKSSNIVTIFDYGVDQDIPYIVMELLEGENLGARLKRVGHVSLMEAERIIVPIAKALDRAHEAQLVHRDLKPDNIFLAREGDDEVPKILDFGIVKSLSSTSARENTEDGAVIGTLHYMSPEQARGQPDIDHRADIWSIGVILFRMLTGRRPFNGGGFGMIILQICSEPIPKATSILPSLPQEIDAFFDRALAKSPADRFSSMKEMAQAFTAIARKYGQYTEAAPSFTLQTQEAQPATIDTSDAPTLVRHPAPAMQSISITVEPVSDMQTISRAPSRSGSLVGIAIAAAITLALGVVAILVTISSTTEEKAQSAAPAESVPLVAMPSSVAEVAPAPTTSSSATTTAKSANTPAPKSTGKKTVDSTQKKKRDFGY